MIIRPYQTPPKKDLRSFGLILGAIFIGVFGLLVPLWKHRPLPVWPFAVGAPLALAGLAIPAALGPLHRAWSAVGMVLGWINTRIILTVVFFVVLTPLGLVMRLLGKDLLGLRLGRGGSSSYRVPSERLARERMKEPF